MTENAEKTLQRAPARVRLLLATERDALAEAVLSRVGVAFEVASERVTTPAALAAALDRGPWDIVVCDPGSAGSDCGWASTIRDHKGDMVRVISASLEEDESRAEQLLRAGARAALGPSLFNRLVPLIERELADARAQRMRYIESIVRHAPDPVLVVDAEGRIQRVSTLAQLLLGYSEAELAGRPVEVLIPEPRRARHAGRRAGYMEMPRFRAMGAGMEFPALAKDGTEIPVEISLAPLQIGEQSLVVCAMRDLRARLSRLAPLLSFSPDPILIVGKNGQIVRANRLLLELLGYSEEELIGQPVERLVPESLRAAHAAQRSVYAAAPVVRPMARGRNFSARARNGTLIPVEISLAPVQVNGDRLIACALRDLREQRRAERITRAILEGTAAETGEAFMRSLVRNLAQALEVQMAVVGEFVGPEKDRAQVLAAWVGDDFVEPFEYPTAGTPCAVVNADGECLVPDHARTLFPEDADLARLGAESYFGVRIAGSTGESLGLLAIVHTAPFNDEVTTRMILRVFAARARAELERKRAEDGLREGASRLQLVADNVPAMIAYTDAEHRILYANRQFTEFYFGTDTLVHGRKLEEVLDGETWGAARPGVERALAGELVHYEARRPDAMGEMRDIDVLLRPHQDVSGTVVSGVYTFIQDVTERRRSVEALRLTNRALEASVDAVMVTEDKAADFRLVYVNPAFERVTGYTEAEALGRNPRFLRGDDHDQTMFAELRVAAHEGREGTILLRNYRKDGTLFWNELHIAPVRGEAGAITHFVGISRDVTDRVRYQDELERHANYDTLTGLPNRNLVRDRLEQSIAQAKRAESIAAAMYVDLDHFKRINDSLGHAVGDQVIAAVGARLAGAIRSGDTVARMGGDEFVAVLADLKREADAGRVGQKLREAIAAPLVVDGHEFVLSASVGVALSPKDGTDGATLLRGADAALYRAKGDGRDCLRFFTAELNAHVQRFVGIERDLRHALEKGELSLHYQPIVRLRTGELIGAEALARWRRSDGSMVPPAEFIPVAEESGLIVTLGRWIIETAVRQAAAWNLPGRKRLVVSMNLSARQFRDPNLVALVREASQAAGVDPSLLKFEITESTVMRDADRAIETLRALKDIGVQLSVDDFGTGYSSLAYLKRFPVDTLKLDRSFVSGLPEDADDLAISRGIIDLAHGLELEVIAEGIETRAQAETLARLGCESAQGYLFGRPVEPQAFDHGPRPKGPAPQRRKRSPRVRW